MSLAESFDIDTLVRQHLPLVRTVLAGVAAHFPRHADREELAQAAALGLVEAAHRFDPSRGVPFPAWAAQRIRGAVLDAIRRLDLAPRSVRSAARVVERAEERLTGELGRAPSVDELAAVTGLSVAELLRLQADVHRAVLLRLDLPVADAGGPDETLGATITDRVQVDPCELLEEREQFGYVRDALDALPDRLRDVVVSYYLQGEASAATAARLGVTESRVSQMRGEALRLMRSGIDTQYADPAAPAVRPVGVAAARRAAYAAALSSRSSFTARLAGLPLLPGEDEPVAAVPVSG